MHYWRLVLLSSLWCLLISNPVAVAKDVADELPRRGFLGASLSSITPKIQEERKLESTKGIVITALIPGGTAESAALQVGDVIRAIEGKPVESLAQVITFFGASHVGDSPTIEIFRDKAPLKIVLSIKERPKESNAQYETIYGSVVSKAGRLRTILTRPRAAGKYPALLFIQGLGCYSVDGVPGGSSEFARIAENFTLNGYVTLRVEKPGCGDSEGGPCEDVDFVTELDGYRQGLKSLKANEFVAPENILIFGHSLGGLWAPALVAEEPVKGVAVFGTVLKPWYEYELENRRRQLILSGADFAAIDADMRLFSRFLNGLYNEQKSPEEIVKAHPELAAIQKEMCPDGAHVYGRSVAFMQQVAALPTSELWSKTDASVLAAWGKAEFVSTEADHRMLADLINRKHPGRGTFIAVDGIDHGLQKYATAEERFQAFHAGKNGDFNPIIIEVLRKWADGLVKKA